MTREEAILLLKQYQGYEPMFPDGETLKHAFDLTDETVDTLLSALRPVSRERVEKAWIGCNNCRTCDSCAYRYTKAEEEPCWSCNTNIYSNYKPEPNRKFCHACGAPMTDEAVQMVMERLEALKDD